MKIDLRRGHKTPAGALFTRQIGRLTALFLVAMLIWAPTVQAQSASTPDSSTQTDPALPVTPTDSASNTATPVSPVNAPTVINASDLQALANLQVNAGSTVIIDFSSSAGTLAGVLNNQGTIYAVSSNNAVNTASLAANQITNQSGAIFTSVLPTGGLAGFSNLIPNLSLLFNAGTFANYGTISSAGSIDITAATSFINQGTINSAANLAISSAGSIVNQGVLAAMQNVNLMSAIGQITNTGTITANLGNINVMSALSQNIAINNLGGVLQALNGTINVRDALFTAIGNINIDGGTLLAKEINLFSGAGVINANIGTISGVLNASADAAHIRTSSDVLTLGSIKMTGDPTFFNDAGSINITGDIQVGESLAILAFNDITSTAGVSLISTTDGLGQGYDINIVAGAALFSPGTTTTTTINTTPPVAFNSFDPVIIVGSGGGGNIDFSASPNLRIDTSSTCLNCTGGNVTLAAYSVGGAGGQIILAPPTTATTGASIITGGNGGGGNGAVTLVAGAASGIGISTGLIDTTGGSGAGTGLITIQTMQPTSDNGNPIVFDTTGAIITGNRLIGDGTIVNASVNINNDLRSNTSVQINAGAGITATPSFVATIPVGALPSAIAMSPNGAFTYVTNQASNTVSVIDTATNTVIATIAVGASPVGAVLTPDGSKLYVANQANDTVSVINTATNTVIATIPVGTSPTGLAVDASGQTVYVTNFDSNNVTRINVATDTQFPLFIPVGNKPAAITVNNANGLVYVGNFASQDMSIYEPATGVVNSSPLGFSPITFGPCPCGTKIYVADSSGTQLVEFLTDSNTTGASVPMPAGSGLIGLAINPTGSTAYATLQGTGNVAVINTLTNSTVATVATPGGGLPLSVGNFAGFVGNNPVAYIGNQATNTVSVLRTPTITAPNVTLTSETGDITATTSPTNISATAINNAVVITSAGNLVSTGGSANTAFQLATVGNLTINAPITAPVIDLHAITGSITNNSTVTAVDLLVLATPTVFNNGLFQVTDSSGTLNIQSPNGILAITQSAGGTLSSPFLMNLNPSQGASIAINGGSLLTAIASGAVFIFGSDGYTIQMNLQRLDGEVQMIPLSATNNPSSINIVTAAGDLLVCGCVITSPATTGNGGPITLAANGGNLQIIGGLQTDANGPGFTAGNITLSALNNVDMLFGGLSARGTGGASGGTITMISQTGDVQIQSFGGAIDVSGGLLPGANGGTVFISGNNVGLDATIDASGFNGGTITIISAATATPFEVGIVCGCTINGTSGFIIADGLNSGGRINLQVAGGLQVDALSAVSASGTIDGGKIQISGLVPGAGTINFLNDGFISANSFGNQNGIIGFNTGNGAATITGSGILIASQFIAFGYLDPVTLLPINPLTLTTTNPFTYNQYNAAQGVIASPFIVVGQGLGPIPTPSVATSLPTPTVLATLPPNLPGFNAPIGSNIVGTTITPNDQNNNSVTTPQNQFLGVDADLQGRVEEFDNAPTGLNGYRVDAINGALIGPAPITANFDASRATLTSNNANLLVVASDDITINTRFGDVHISAGSIVFIANSPNSVAIFNLHDGRKGNVYIETSGQKVVIGLGYQTVLTDDKQADFQSVNPTKLIAVRDIVRKDLSPSIAMFDAEFSLPAALNAIVPLHDMRMSQTPTDRTLASRIMRNAAILQVIATGHGPFKPAP